MMRAPLSFALAALLLATAGCATEPPVAGPAVSQSYKTLAAPSPGLARVYILPTLSKGMFTDIDGYSEISLFPDGSDRGAEIGSTGKGAFLAFDIAPGDYDMIARTGEPFTKASGAVTFEAGHTYFFRPVFFRSSAEMDKNWNGSGKTAMGFDTVDPTTARTLLPALAMAQVTPSGEAFFKRMATAHAGPVATVPRTEPSSAAPRVEPPAAAPTAFSVLEGKLKDLQRLRDENLITQDEYDAKRRSLLEKY